jgi:hypothetical protein
MDIADAQREMRTRYVGGFYGQLVSGVLWLLAAVLGTWSSQRAAITTLVVGGFFIFPVTELLVRLAGERCRLSGANGLRGLAPQVAFVLPLSMPLLLPIGAYRLTWFFPAMTLLLGAHYTPFVFLYGMRMFGALAAVLVAGGIWVALRPAAAFATGAWYTAIALLAFAVAGRYQADREWRARPQQWPVASGDTI